MAPPVFKLPPPKTKAQKGQQGAFTTYINAHPKLKPYAQQIYKAAVEYGIDPVYYASLINLESGGNPRAVSKAGAIGLAQIMPLHIGEAVPWDPGRKVTAADLRNPAFNIRWGAYYFGQQVRKYGSYEAAYKQGYNHGYKGTVFKDVPKGYVPTGTQKSPQEVAQRGVEVAGAKQQLTDPWVVVQKNGKVKYVNSAVPPAYAVTYAGQYLTRSQFMQMWHNRIDPMYQSYLGRNASPTEVRNILRTGISDYALTNALTKRPGFIGSPVWKRDAPGYVGVAKSIFGDNWNPNDPANQGLIRYAIANNLGGDGFASTLRARPEYLKSNEYGQKTTGLENVYRTIYGQPDENGKLVIREAALQGWDENQFAGYLRSQPHYTSSPEYETKLVGFLGNLGLITGARATLKPGQAEPGPSGGAKLPDSDRIAGTPQSPSPTPVAGLTPTLGG